MLNRIWPDPDGSPQPTACSTARLTFCESSKSTSAGCSKHGYSLGLFARGIDHIRPAANGRAYILRPSPVRVAFAGTTGFSAANKLLVAVLAQMCRKL